MHFLIPKNVRARFEFFQGFGFRELFLLLASLIIGAAISIPLFLITRSPFAFIFAALFGTIGFVAGKPDPRTGMNGLDHFKAMRAFQSKRKLYFYRYGDGR